MEILDLEQNSEKWYRARAGIPTASCFKIVMAGGRSGERSLTRQKYLYTLAGEILTGEPADPYTNIHMQRGHDLEPEARDYYALITDTKPQQVGFIRAGRTGCSPDSLIGDDGMLEIKTAMPSILIEMIFRNRFPPEHKAQVQGQLWIAEREWSDLMIYARGVPPFIVRAMRDEPYIRMMAKEIDRFNDELDAIVAKIRAYGGDENAPLPEVSKPVASPWAGLRPAVRRRLQESIELIMESGGLRRSDIQRIGEVSVAQASKDLSEIKKRLPGLMTYDRHAKLYVLNRKKAAKS